MAEHAGSPLIAKRFFVDFLFALTGSPSVITVDSTIAAVPLDRTLVRRASYHSGRSDGGGSGVYWWVNEGGVWFTSPTNLRLYGYGGESNGILNNAVFRAEVIILNSKPKSLQNVVGNGAAMQTISPVDPNKAQIYDAMFQMKMAYTDLYPTFTSGTQISWSASLTANDRYQVVEF